MTVTPDKNVDREPSTDADAAIIEARRKAKYYCPGCGKPARVAVDCNGRPEAPHPPIEVVSTKEIAEGADLTEQTPAPDTVG